MFVCFLKPNEEILRNILSIINIILKCTDGDSSIIQEILDLCSILRKYYCSVYTEIIFLNIKIENNEKCKKLIENFPKNSINEKIEFLLELMKDSKNENEICDNLDSKLINYYFNTFKSVKKIFFLLFLQFYM